MSFEHMLKFRTSIESAFPKNVKVAHHFFVPSAVNSAMLCPICRLGNAHAPMGMLGYILEDMDWTPEAPASLPRFRVYVIAECHVCNHSQVVREIPCLDDIELMEKLDIAIPFGVPIGEPIGAA